MLDIVVVNWNSDTQLLNLANSFFENEFYQKFLKKFIIIDNYSEDNSIELVKNYFKLKNLSNYLILIMNDKNEGFAKACNIASSYCTTEYILFLNPDTIIVKGSVSKPIDFKSSNSIK